jgi:hypothetical protein
MSSPSAQRAWKHDGPPASEVQRSDPKFRELEPRQESIAAHPGTATGRVDSADRALSWSEAGIIAAVDYPGPFAASVAQGGTAWPLAISTTVRIASTTTFGWSIGTTWPDC